MSDTAQPKEETKAPAPAAAPVGLKRAAPAAQPKQPAFKLLGVWVDPSRPGAHADSKAGGLNRPRPAKYTFVVEDADAKPLGAIVISSPTAAPKAMAELKLPEGSVAKRPSEFSVEVKVEVAKAIAGSRSPDIDFRMATSGLGLSAAFLKSLTGG